MTDIKETIQGLYALKTYLASKAIEEAIEGHGPARESLIEMQKVVDSAVNLLKEQEAVEPKKIVNENFPIGDYRRTIEWHCGQCEQVLIGAGNYCSHCGKKVKCE